MTLSRRICTTLFPGPIQESLCSRAFRLQRVSLFWRIFVRVMGSSHCGQSHHYYWGALRSPNEP